MNAAILVLASFTDVGTNVSELRYYGISPFANVLKATSGPREVKRIDGKEQWYPDANDLRFDENGTLTYAQHRAVIAVTMREGYRPGKYRVTYLGEPHDGTKFNDGDGWQRGAEFEHNGSGTLHVDIKVGENPNWLSCRHVDDEEQVWARGLIESLKPFDVVRYMDWQSMNHAWGGERSAYLQGFEGHENYGVDIRWIVQLSQASDTVPWICVHESWPIDRVRQIFDALSAANLKAYVEFGNEIWNTRLYHGKWARDNSGSEPYRVWGAKQAVPVAKLAKSYGFVSVLGTQMAGENGQIGNTKAIVEGLGVDIQYFDVLATNGYFGNGIDAESTTAFEDLRTQLESLKMRSQVLQQYATSKGIKYAFYECGQHVVSPSAGILNADERMQPIYADFTSWMQKATDVGCFYTLAFRDRKNGTRQEFAWGFDDKYHGMNGPKLAGVLDALDVEPEPPIDPPAPSIDLIQQLRDEWPELTRKWDAENEYLRSLSKP